jgi:putative endonuclease
MVSLSNHIIQSQIDGSFYIGHTRDLKGRLARHNQGRSRYTKTKRTWMLLYSEQFKTRGEASNREAGLKTLKRKDLLLGLMRAVARPGQMLTTRAELVRKLNTLENKYYAIDKEV